MLLFAGIRFNYRVSISRIIIDAKPVFQVYNDLADLRKEEVDKPYSILFSTIREAWEYTLDFRDMGMVLEPEDDKKSIPDWLYITPRFIHPFLKELILDELNQIWNQIPEDRRKILLIWELYLNKRF